MCMSAQILGGDKVQNMFSDFTSQLLTKALDTASTRQRVISNNLANINTPGFKRSYVTFEEELRKTLETNNRINLNSIQKIEPQINKDNSTTMRLDGNNVDMDQEMVNLAMNSINYNTAVQQLNKKLGMLRYVISEGRR